MIKETKQFKGYTELVNQVIEKVKNQGYSEIKADIGEYDTPPQIINKSKNISFTPDVMATKKDSKAYFEIANKNCDTDILIDKWKALSVLAEMKNGKLQIFVPYGHMNFTTQLLHQNRISADIVKL